MQFDRGKTIIEYFTPKKQYSILWLKYIWSVNLSVHCAPCLCGYFDRRITADTIIKDFKLRKSGVIYLCGIARYGGWKNNLHYAWKFKEGESFEVDDEFSKLKVLNAVRLNISPKYINWNLPQSGRKEFNTCRNWWFANMFAKGILDQWTEEGKPKQLSLF